MLSGCDEIPPDVVKTVKKKTEVDMPLCQVKSGVDGLFVFPSVPSGEYTLVSISLYLSAKLTCNRLLVVGTVQYLDS